MDDDSLNALRAAQPSFLDGKGLFPMASTREFQDFGSARVIRSDSQATIIRQDSQIPDPQPPVPYLPPMPKSGMCGGYEGQSGTLIVSGVVNCPSPPGGVSPVNGTYSLAYTGYFPPSGTLLGFCLWDSSTGDFQLYNWDDGTWGAQTPDSGNAFVSADLMTPTGGGGVPFGTPIPNAQTCVAGGGTVGQATFSFP